MLSAIVATDLNGCIGKGGKLPWYLPDDLSFFKDVTLHCTVIMGRATFDSLGKPLAYRRNIVLSRQNININGVEVYNEVPSLLKALNSKPAFIIGGSQIYDLLWEFVDTLYLTVVKTVVQNGDTFFNQNLESWRNIKTTSHPRDDRHMYEFTQSILKRK